MSTFPMSVTALRRPYRATDATFQTVFCSPSSVRLRHLASRSIVATYIHILHIQAARRCYCRSEIWYPPPKGTQTLYPSPTTYLLIRGSNTNRPVASIVSDPKRLPLILLTLECDSKTDFLPSSRERKTSRPTHRGKVRNAWWKLSHRHRRQANIHETRVAGIASKEKCCTMTEYCSAFSNRHHMSSPTVYGQCRFNNNTRRDRMLRNIVAGHFTCADSCTFTNGRTAYY